MAEYFKYYTSIFNRPYKLGRKEVGPQSCSVPGNILDSDRRKRFKHKFDKWVKLPVAAQKLYWRTHPRKKREKRDKNGAL